MAILSRIPKIPTGTGVVFGYQLKTQVLKLDRNVVLWFLVGYSEALRGPQRVILLFSVVGDGEYFCFPLRALGGRWYKKKLFYGQTLFSYFLFSEAPRDISNFTDFAFLKFFSGGPQRIFEFFQAFFSIGLIIKNHRRWQNIPIINPYINSVISSIFSSKYIHFYRNS